MTISTKNRRAAAKGVLLVLAASALLPAAACSIDELLTVDDPDVASPGSLTGAAALPVLLTGARSDFQVAFSGSGGSEGQVTYTGLFTDELKFVESFDTRLQIDKRDIRNDNTNVEAILRNVMRARASAEVAVERFEEFDPDTEGHALSLALAGFTYIMVGENYCTGIPFSRLIDGQPQYGAPESTDEIFQRAVDRFQTAVTMATALGDDELLNLARVGLGRAHLNLGNFGQAGSAVESVPDDYVFVIEHSENTPRQYNGIFSFTHAGRRFSVVDVEAGEGLPFLSADDPRVPWVLDDDLAWDGQSDLYLQLNYDSRRASVPLATGIEARLIEAEAQLATNYAGAGGTLEILNALRANMAPAGSTLLPLPAAATPDEQENQLFAERGFWLYLTAHRLGDLRRMIRDYQRSADAVFPSGQYWKAGQSYGDDVSFPLSRDESANPNYVECDPSVP